MRLHQKENKIFRKAIVDAGFEESDFLFSKKSGWLSITYLKDKSYLFKYHRKDETILNDQLQWEKKTSYLCKEGKLTDVFASLEEVGKKFQSFLTKLTLDDN